MRKIETITLATCPSNSSSAIDLQSLEHRHRLLRCLHYHNRLQERRRGHHQITDQLHRHQYRHLFPLWHPCQSFNWIDCLCAIRASNTPKCPKTWPNTGTHADTCRSSQASRCTNPRSTPYDGWTEPFINSTVRTFACSPSCFWTTSPSSSGPMPLSFTLCWARITTVGTTSQWGFFRRRSSPGMRTTLLAFSSFPPTKDVDWARC